MKKVISVGDLCCERCANRLACKLEMCDDELKDAVQSAGFEVLSIAPRKSIFA